MNNNKSQRLTSQIIPIDRLLKILDYPSDTVVVGGCVLREDDGPKLALVMSHPDLPEMEESGDIPFYRIENYMNKNHQLASRWVIPTNEEPDGQ